MTFSFLQGIPYRDVFIYNFLTFLKLGYSYDLRFKIVQPYLHKDDVILDVCAGYGRLKKFIPKECTYHCIDASPTFLKKLKQKEIPSSLQNINEKCVINYSHYTVVVMIISLCHFPKSRIHTLLDSFTKMGNRVIIIEEVIKTPKQNHTWLRKIMNYLCCVDYNKHLSLLTFEEFKDILSKHNYKVTRYNNRYSIGTFGV